MISRLRWSLSCATPRVCVPRTAETGATLSVLDIERRSHELLVQSFHLFDENQMVIKTQAIFEAVKGT